MEFNISDYRIRISESLDSIHFYIYAKEGMLLDSYLVDKIDLENHKGVSRSKGINIKDISPTILNLTNTRKDIKDK